MMRRYLASAMLVGLVASPLTAAAQSYQSNLQLSSPVASNTAAAPSPTYSSTYNNIYYTQPPSAEAPAQPQEVAIRGQVSTVPQGTIMMMKLNHPVSSYSSKIGDTISGTLEADVYFDNQIAIPEGSTVEGAVTGVTPAGRMGKPGAIEMQFSVIRTPFGTTIPIKAHLVTADNSGIMRGDTEQAQVMKGLGVAAGGTAAGTLLGTAAGGIFGAAGAGAVLGVATGAVGGIGYALTRQGKQVEIPGGARMSIVLDEPATLN